MKEYYRIGEISRFLDLSTENIRFYEKEGLIHPIKDQTNGYRLYRQSHIYQLLEVMFYRKMELSIDAIRQIQKDIYSSDARELIQIRKKEVMDRIRKLKLLLQKLGQMEENYNAIELCCGKYFIQALPSFYIMEKRPEKLFEHRLKEKVFVSTDLANLCTFGSRLEFCNGKWKIVEDYILMKRKYAVELELEKELQEKSIITSRRGIYTVFCIEEEDYLNLEIEKLRRWMSQQGYEIPETVLFNYMLTVKENEKEVSYGELFVPVV